jgi:hypothetical protein
MSLNVLRSNIGSESQYFQDFQIIVEQERLELPYFYSCHTGKIPCNIGQIINKFQDYEKALRLQKFLELYHENLFNYKTSNTSPIGKRLFLKVEDVFSNVRVGVGLKDGHLDIFGESMTEESTSYPLIDLRKTRAKKERFIYKGQYVDKYGRLVDKDKKLIDKNGNKVEEDNAIWKVDIQRKWWVEIPLDFLQKTHKLIKK